MILPWRRFRTACAQRHLLRCSSWEHPCKPPPYRGMHDPFKPASGVQRSGPWDPWLPVGENSRLFAQPAPPLSNQQTTRRSSISNLRSKFRKLKVTLRLLLKSGYHSKGHEATDTQLPNAPCVTGDRALLIDVPLHCSTSKPVLNAAVNVTTQRGLGGGGSASAGRAPSSA